MVCAPIFFSASVALALVMAGPAQAQQTAKTGMAAGAAKVPSRIDRKAVTPPPVPEQQGCPAPPGGEAAADWRPPPIPPKEARGGPVVPGGEAAADWRPPPIPPKVAQGGEVAADWRPPPIPPHDAPGCAPRAAESADWRPPPIPPKR